MLFPVTSLDDLHDAVLRCTRCDLAKTRIRAVPGEGPSETPIMILGEAPGATNEREGRPFVGMGGSILNGILQSVGLPRSRCYITNAVRCRPATHGGPSPVELSACRPYLMAELALLKTRLVITLGRHASAAILGRAVSLRTEHGCLFEGPAGVMVCPSYHPNALRYVKNGRDIVANDIRSALHATDLHSLVETPAGYPPQGV